MPQVVLRAETADHQEVQVKEYVCDVADCPNAAEHVLGFTRAFGPFAVCELHRQLLSEKNED